MDVRPPQARAVVMAAACGALALGCGRCFLLPQSGVRGPQSGRIGAPLGGNPSAPPAPTAPHTHEAPVAAFPYAAALLLAGAAALHGKRARPATSTARRVTLEQIKSMTIEDVPASWRKKISLGMARRDLVVSAIRKKLDEVFFMMVWNKDNMTSFDLEAARALFPDSVMCRGLKNSLVRKAMEGTPWETFSKVLRGSNMYIFVYNDTDLKPTINAYIKLERQFNRADKIAQVFEKVGKKYKFQLKPLVGGCMRGEWNVISPQDIPKFKDFPTKLELIAKIAGSIKQVPQKLATAMNQLPRKTAVGVKKIVEKMEEQGKSKVGDVVA